MSVKKLLPDVNQVVKDTIADLAETIEQYSNTTEAQEQARVDEFFYPGAIQVDLLQQIQYATGDVEKLKEFLRNECVQSQTKPLLIENQEKLLDKLNDYDEDRFQCDVWLYQNALYCVVGKHTQSQQQLMILAVAVKENQKFERLKAKFSTEQSENVKHERIRIPESVRIEVWRRDQGKCAGCGSREKLEYDHIVPVSRGGSNTARNVELLCEVCNRSKGDRIQ